MQRRHFLGSAAAALLAGCQPPPPALEFAFAGIDLERGHQAARPAGPRLPPAPTLVRRAQVIIAGGGVAWLAAARPCAWPGCTTLPCWSWRMPRRQQPGRCGEWRGCPLGAHYLPVPGDHAPEVQDLLEELGLRQRVAGRWQYDERHLCHSPQERLYFEREWQEGLLPMQGVAKPRWSNTAVFAGRGRCQPRCPLHHAAVCRFGCKTGLAPAHQALDAMTFEAWLQQQGLDDAHLRWYLDYCCRDDYGAAWPACRPGPGCTTCQPPRLSCTGRSRGRRPRRRAHLA